MFYDPNQSFDNRSLRNAAPHIYKKAAEICAGEDEHSPFDICNSCGNEFYKSDLNEDGYCPECAREEQEKEENQ